MLNFFCTQCNKSYPSDTKAWRCACGGPFSLSFQPPRFDPKVLVHRYPSLWRYRETIPIESDEDLVTYNEGFTPLTKHKFSGIDVDLKLDYLFPTGSIKDRGSTVLISKVRELGISEIVEDSSGNAGASIAAYCARAGIRVRIFVPDSASPNKKQQIELYGARLEAIRGTREDVAEATHRVADRGVYYASQIWNPFYIHGVKTLAYEIAEQMKWNVPDFVLAPLGVGTIILGLYQGFNELRELGVFDKFPKIVGVQSAQCCPLYDLWQKGKALDSYLSTTIAEGIAHQSSPRDFEVIESIRKTDGAILIVKEEEIVQAFSQLANAGFYVEPTSAVVLPGLKRLAESTSLSNRRVVVILTGSGLKYRINSKRQGAEQPKANI